MYKISYQWVYFVVVVQSLSCVRLFAIPWTAGHQASLSFTISWSLLKFISIESMMLSNHLIFCHPLLLLPSIFPCIKVFSSIRVFFNESALRIRWPKYWSFGPLAASVLPMNIQSWFPLGLTDLISLQSKRLSRVSPNPQFKSIISSVLSLLHGPTLTSIRDYCKIHSFD